ncbi:MAG: electron transfer flavoprotein subunit alpha/FixB family protein [Dethiobacter sp.]|mgnify:CR=1 FL=1|nr:electron transfer flavoprotein subunit alpha/FixB family protein [Dethiobacter sp.]MBS3899211.1 electron transfer flavoprotein subunit alpha/FixB family protein [Dethiobacter sp.]MCL4462577.1 electron transfer flavoprotein subunit alpha/FixB family protein [Bacillota bacterium]
MGDIFVLAEHRRGELREVSLEMLAAASDVAPKLGGNIIAILLGSGVNSFAEKLAGYSDKVLYVDDPLFADYNSEKYQQALSDLIGRYQPELVMVAHTTQGVDMAPALAVELKMPFVTDVVGLSFEGGELQPVRTYYQGKINADFAFKGKPPYLITVRESSFNAGDPTKFGTVEKILSPMKEDVQYRKFVEYIEAVVGDVDISQAEILVGIGRGLREEKNLPMIEDLAKAINAVIAGSRAAIDAGWLPHDRQVGTSGKNVKPKVYIAIGISGAFQHLAGMKAAKTIIAINKDPNAPIFTVADYAIVDDLFKVVPKLTEKLKELRA